MARVTIYHNPRCNKSRQTLDLLDQRGVEPRVIEYLGAPPSAEEVAEPLDMLQLQPRKLMRSKEPEYRELGLDDRPLAASS